MSIISALGTFFVLLAYVLYGSGVFLILLLLSFVIISALAILLWIFFILCSALISAIRFAGRGIKKILLFATAMVAGAVYAIEGLFTKEKLNAFGRKINEYLFWLLYG